MGKSLSKLPQIDPLLRTISPQDIEQGVSLSLLLQALAYYFGLGLYIDTSFEKLAKSDNSAEISSAKYAKTTISHTFSGFNSHFVLGAAHQLLASHLVTHQMRLNLPALPIALLAGSSSLFFAFIAWFYPVKLLVSAELAASGHDFAALNLQKLFETYSNTEKLFIAFCHFSGIGLMAAALLKALNTPKQRLIVLGYLLFTGRSCQLWLTA